MEFNNLCRNLRDKYKSVPSKEIELQIVTQMYTAVFENDDRIPQVINFELDLKPLLKNQSLMESWRAFSKNVEFLSQKQRSHSFFDFVVIDGILVPVTEELGVPYWNIRHYTRKSALKYSVEIVFSRELNNMK